MQPLLSQAGEDLDSGHGCCRHGKEAQVAALPGTPYVDVCRGGGCRGGRRCREFLFLLPELEMLEGNAARCKLTQCPTLKVRTLPLEAAEVSIHMGSAGCCVQQGEGGHQGG